MTNFNQTNDLLYVLRRIEKLVDSIEKDKMFLNNSVSNETRLKEINSLVQIALQTIQEPLNNGK